MRSLFLVLALALAGCGNVSHVSRAPAVSYSTAFNEARPLAAGHAGLSGSARRDNAAAIDRLLAQLDDATLARDAARLPAGDPLYNFAGRALLRRGLPLPHAFDRGDVSFGSANRPPADSDGYRPPLRVGILLPLAGSQAAAAASVRDGYLTGYYGEARRRPSLRFYDTSTGFGAAYARASADGNDLLVGPLTREEVDTAFSNDASDVPMLALNRGNKPPSAGSAAFSLSPEDEGVSLAQALIDRGSRAVLIIAGSEDVQRRTAQSAKLALERRGVRIIGNLAYGTQMTDALNHSDAAPDAVLLVLKGPQARTLAPQLASAGLASLPRYASSQITSGTGKPAEDAALDGIIFPTETWLVRRVPGLPSQASAAAQAKTAKGPAARLFAFGYDAWLLTGHLEQLAQNPNASVSGATGRLSLDGFGNVLRRPSWSQFTGGVPVSLSDGAR
ncbi:MAG: penicillin-binding protein activator [Thermomonas sp.]|uniref:penicillin-binding protein activator n=1 Tax=Thermomonas sp. TaxID=1971895 RepID=UPI001DA7E0D7|nr:penicillin-binding protein activator [Thermomonas sp.]MBZ0088061.1 penicillin-binding protein activator [Thermomonas sp.]